MPNRSEAIQAYIRAKDENRPHLLRQGFLPDAVVTMVVDTKEISFPPRLEGIDAIADTLVRRFGQIYENVYTFCIAPQPEGPGSAFDCEWLVGMSEKAGGAVRLGCGRYRWAFAADAGGQVSGLEIAILTMRTMPAAFLAPVMAWFAMLPYPWCPLDAAARMAPAIADVTAVLDRLGHNLDRGEDARGHHGA